MILKLSQYLIFAEDNPDMILNGETPRLIDEWQLVPMLWDAIRYTVDHRAGMGQFILTGSAKPADREKISHSGTGRFAWLRMRPMSLFESGDSTGDVSLSKLFKNPGMPIGCEAKSDLQKNSISNLSWWVACRFRDMPEDVALNPAKRLL